MQAWAAMVTRTSSVISKPLQPSKCFSAMKICVVLSSSSCSGRGSLAAQGNLDSMILCHSAGTGRALICFRRLFLNHLSINFAPVLIVVLESPANNIP